MSSRTAKSRSAEAYSCPIERSSRLESLYDSPYAASTYLCTTRTCTGFRSRGLRLAGGTFRARQFYRRCLHSHRNSIAHSIRWGDYIVGPFTDSVTIAY